MQHGAEIFKRNAIWWCVSKAGNQGEPFLFFATDWLYPQQ